MIYEQFQPFGRLIETDYTRFDRSISYPILKQVQNLIFNWCNSEYYFNHALKLALKTRGSSANGVSYKIEGTRCSGDSHTSLGNGLINAFLTHTCLRTLHNTHWTSVHEGDDGIIGTSIPTAKHATQALLFLKVLGFQVKMDVHNQMDDVSFCGRHFYTQNSRFYEHADVLRALDKYHTTTSGCKDLPLIRAKAMSYYHTDRNTPLLGPLTYAILQATDGVSNHQLKRAFGNADDRWATRHTEIDFNEPRHLGEVPFAARISVFRRTGITPLQQMALEAAYLQMATRRVLLVCPRIQRDWVIRQDGIILGNPASWFRHE